MSFKADLKKFNKKTQKINEKVFKGSVITLFNNVKMNTPVDVGTLSRSWQPTINSPSASLKEVGGDAIITKVSQAKLGDSIYLVNNLPYAEKIAETGGTQQPEGWFHAELLKFEKIVKANVVQAKKGGS